MKKYHVHLTENEIEELGKMKDDLGIIKAEIIRRAIDEKIKEHKESKQ